MFDEQMAAGQHECVLVTLLSCLGCNDGNVAEPSRGNVARAHISRESTSYGCVATWLEWAAGGQTPEEAAESGIQSWRHGRRFRPCDPGGRIGVSEERRVARRRCCGTAYAGDVGIDEGRQPPFGR